MATRSVFPSSMRAAAIDRFGPPSVIKIHTLPIPQPRPNQIVIAVHAAGVGSWDESIRDGSWKPPGRTRFPKVLGTDGAGVVVAKGTRVKRFRIGDRVYGYDSQDPSGGFYAEYVALDEGKAGRVPERLDDLEAGAGAVTALTAQQGIDGALKVRRGETVLIFGATGAVGTLAVQFAKRHGARVLASGSGRKAATLLRRLGADAVIDMRRDDIAERLRKLAPDGIDAVLALAGGDELERCLDFLNDKGRVAHPNGVEPEPKPRRKFRIRTYDGEAGPRQFAQLARAIAQAKLSVPVAGVYPLGKAADAHRRLNRHVIGRMVLRVGR